MTLATTSSPAELETQVWTGRGMNPQEGTLRLAGGRLRFELNGAVAFDAPVAQLRVTWPWYGFKCQFWAHAPERKYYVSFLHTGNSLYSWWIGVKLGRLWHRAIEASRG